MSAETRSPYNWHNLAIGVKVSFNSGALILLAMLGMYVLLAWGAFSKDVAALLPGLWPWYFGLFGVGLGKRAYDKKQGEKAAIEKLKLEAPPCPPTPPEGAQG